MTRLTHSRRDAVGKHDGVRYDWDRSYWEIECELCRRARYTTTSYYGHRIGWFDNGREKGLHAHIKLMISTSQGGCILKWEYGHLHHCNGGARESECSMKCIGGVETSVRRRNKMNLRQKERRIEKNLV
jgi:hypothetical protein